MSLLLSARSAGRSRAAVALACASLVRCARSEPANTAPTPIDPVGLAALQARERAQRQQGAPSEPEPPRAMWRAPSIDVSVTPPSDTSADGSITDASLEDAAVEDGSSHDAHSATHGEPTHPPPDFAAIRSAIEPLLSRREPPTLVAVQRAQRGLGFAYDHRALLERRGARYVGRVRCEYRSRSAWAEVTVSRQQMLAQLVDAPSIALSDEQYHADALSTDNYPMRLFSLHFQRQSATVVSWSQTRDGAPWGAREGASARGVDWSATIGVSGDAIRATYLRLLTVSGIDRCEAFVECVNTFEYRGRFASTEPPPPLACRGFRVAVSQAEQREAHDFGSAHFH